MLYGSFSGPLGPAILQSYGRRAEAIANRRRGVTFQPGLDS